MEGFVGHKKEFEVDSLRDGEPVELMEDEGDVVMGLRVSDRASSRVLDVLEFTGDFWWWTIEEIVAVVQTKGDEGMKEGFCSCVL